MSAFEVVLTPTRPKYRRNSEAREPTDVMMAPFSAKSIVQFEDVPVGKTARRILRIFNPSSEDIEVRVHRPISAEYNISINWSEMIVPRSKSVEMEMIWSPLEEVTCKEILQLLDNRNFRKDVMVIMKTRISKPVKPVRKFPTISSNNNTNSYVRTLRLKSPKNSAAKQQKPKSFNTQSTLTHNKPWTQSAAPATQRAPTKPRPPTTAASNSTRMRAPPPRSVWADTKCRLREEQKREVFDEVTINFTHTSPSPLAERNIYAHQQKSMNNNYTATPRTSAATTVKTSIKSPVPIAQHKENVSPLTPTNVFEMFDNIKFTPVNTGTTRKNCSTFGPDLDNLANWPTPVSVDTLQVNLSTLQPRRLNTSINNCADTTGDANSTQMFIEMHHTMEQKTPAGVITNKTFEIKRGNETLNISSDSLDSSIGAYGLTLNKTTTISTTPKPRTLTMIEEEEDGPTSICSEHKQKTDGKGTTTPTSCSSPALQQQQGEDLLRDIKLIGTPLRKYSESMKDLSLRSPSRPYAASQGSMPNLNEMECIRSFEQNRYFYNNRLQQSLVGLGMSIIEEQNSSISMAANETNTRANDSEFNIDLGVTSQIDLAFNQSEILAQSSRFNLTDIGGGKSRRNSPVLVSGKWRDLRGVSPKSMRVKPSECSPKKCASQKRNSHDLSFSDSPSNESLATTSSERSSSTKSSAASARAAVARNNRPMQLLLVSPPKRQRVDNEFAFERPSLFDSSRSKNWSRTLVKKVRVLKANSSINTTPKKPTQPNIEISPICYKSERLYDPEMYLQFCINPDPFAASTVFDPFLASTMYLDEIAVQKHQEDFKKWLNALVTIPSDMDADSDAKIDVGKLFNEVRHKELQLAPTKEEQSMDYLVQHRLEVVRRAAVYLYLSEEVRVPCGKVAVYVSKNALRMRSDRNLHLDVVMQRNILELLLCFNPMWLRIGLEVVYGEKIHLRSNTDIIGLSTFILNRLFRDKLLEQRYSRAYPLSEEYKEYIKKYTLTKMLCLLLFLDKAKQKRIIKYNPCLFIKKSPHKQTREILLKFSSELLGNIGDITRDLKRLGYVLEHKQNFLDEFNYAFHNLAVDLRDGVRLTRVMEIILLRDDLSQQLRVPAISRLQRIYNVNLGLRALNEADFELSGDITAADIVDGHREKTLSLLWQIIYKFRSPKFHAAARVLQKWWRSKWLAVCMQRRVREKEERRRHRAATIIQTHYRGYIARRWAKLYRQERTRAAIVLQKHTRRYLLQKRYKQTVAAACRIQCWYRACTLTVQCRRYFVELRSCTIYMQRVYRRRLLSKKLLLVAEQYRLHCEEKRSEAATCIQIHWRAYCSIKVERAGFLRMRESAVLCQRKWRATLAMRQQSNAFLAMRAAAICIQQRFRATRQMRQQRAEYLKLKSAAIVVQRWYRGLRRMREARAQYQSERVKIIQIQQRWRTTLAMRVERSAYQQKRAAAVCIQSWYRSWQLTQQHKLAYERLRNSCITIQIRWRATLEARFVRKQYQQQLESIICVQRRWRAILQMRQERANYQRIRAASCTIQRWYRSHRQTVALRGEYLRMRASILCVQRQYRAQLSVRAARTAYTLLRTKVVYIQQKFRGHCLMRQQRAEFLLLRRTTVHLQQKFRGKRLMQQQRAEYIRLRSFVISLQSQARGLLARRRLQALMTPEFMEQRRRRKAAGVIQRFWRGYRVRKCFQSIQMRLIRRNMALWRQTAHAANTLSNKISHAVCVLRDHSSASEILHVLMCLDRISRTVPHILMNHSDFVSTFCYGVMAQTIRSEVDKQLIRYCSRIILNLARYNSTTANTFQESGLVTVAQMLLRWCDKDSEIFNTLCTVIWLFAHCPYKRHIIREYMTTPEAIYVVRETKKLVARKERMNQNLRKPVAAALASKRPQQFPLRALPSLEPDYGVIHSKPYTFVSSVFAFDMVLDELEIEVA